MLSCLALLACDVLTPSDGENITLAQQNQERRFSLWLSASQDRGIMYRDFVTYLENEGVDDVLPPWTLLIPDRQYMSAKCPIDAFVFPPKALWPNVVPSLKVLRAHVIPAVGRVQVASAYRPASFNACIGGAKRSAHLLFSAFDLVPSSQMDRDDLFKDLCVMWRRQPPSSKIGLGTYFSATDPNRNRIGRFHIDTLGKRTWGSDFRSASSYCLRPETR
jgi:hypothetical protein